MRSRRPSDMTAPEPVPAYTVDLLRADELNFILETWKMNNRWTCTELPDIVYNAGMNRLIGALARDQRLIVARSVEGKLIGYLCYRPHRPGDPEGATCVHFAYVKKRYRNQGVMTALLKSSGWLPGDVIIGSHKTKAPKATRRKHNIYFNDFFIKLGTG